MLADDFLGGRSFSWTKFSWIDEKSAKFRSRETFMSHGSLPQLKNQVHLMTNTVLKNKVLYTIRQYSAY